MIWRTLTALFAMQAGIAYANDVFWYAIPAALISLSCLIKTCKD